MSAKLQVEKYFEALQRLIDRGATINNDTVAKEAGSGRGSIKNSRIAYAGLLAAIDKAALIKVRAKPETDPTPGLRKEKKKLIEQLDSALEREVALLHEVYSLREEVRQLREQPGNTGLAVVRAPKR